MKQRLDPPDLLGTLQSGGARMLVPNASLEIANTPLHRVSIITFLGRCLVENTWLITTFQRLEDTTNYKQASLLI